MIKGNKDSVKSERPCTTLEEPERRDIMHRGTQRKVEAVEKRSRGWQKPIRRRKLRQKILVYPIKTAVQEEQPSMNHTLYIDSSCERINSSQHLYYI